MNTLKKIVASSVVVTTVLSLVVAIAPVKAAVATAGDLIKQSGNSSVYYLGADNKRYVFPNEATYKSWYSDFSLVKVIPQAELEGYGIGGNVTIRPGTKLVKITTNPKVYAVEPGGSLKAIPDEATAKTLYGADWAKRVVDVPDAFFINYKDTGKTLSAGAYPAGSLVKFSAGSPDVYYINADGTASKIADESAFNANRFQFANVLDGASVPMPTKGSDITGAVATDLTSGAGGTTYTGGSGVTVALAGTTAASASIIAGQSLANLASFNFTASNDGASVINTLKLKRTGISKDSDLDNVYLYDGATRLTDGAVVSSNYVTFSVTGGIVTVPAGQTKTLTVKADVDSAAGSGQIGMEIESASDVTTGGASVSGSFPAVGNQMSIVTGQSLAGVAIGAATPSVAASVKPGDSDVRVWQSNVDVTTHDVNFKYLKLREIGSISATDLKDLTLYVDGKKIAGPVQLSSDFYATFDMSNSPVLLTQGTRNIEVRATVVDGSSKNFKFAVRYPVDIVVEDTQYGVAVVASGTGTNATTAQQSVDSGSMTVIKAADSASGNVTLGTSNVSLGKFTFTAYGETVKVETLKVKATVTTSAADKTLRNGKLIVNGNQVGSTLNLNSSGVEFTTNFYVTPGTPATLEVKADVANVTSTSTNQLANNDTIKVSVVANSGNAQAQTSLSSLDVPSTSNVDGSTVTVQQGGMTLSKQGNYGNQTVVVPQTAYKLAAFNLVGNSTEDVNLNSIEVNVTPNGSSTLASPNITDLYVKYGTAVTSIKSSVNNSSNLFSISSTLAKNATLPVEVYGTINSSATGSSTLGVKVSGTTAQSGKSVDTGTLGSHQGQLMTVGNGSLTATFDATPAASLVVAGQTKDVAVYRFSAVNNGFTVNELTFNVTGDGSAVSSLAVKDGSTVVASAPLSGNTVTLPMSVAVANGTTKRLTVSLTLGNVGTGAGNTANDVTVTLASGKQTGDGQSQGALTITTGAANTTVVYKTIPTIALATLPSTVLTGGTQTVSKFSVTSDAAGAISWKKITFAVTKSAAPTFGATSTTKLYDADTNTEVLGTVTYGGGDITATSAVTNGTITFVANNEQQVSGTKNYVLKSVISGTLDTGNNVSVAIAGGSAQGASAAYSAGLGNFVWSDQSAASHSESTADWNNEFLVKNLPTDSQTLSK